ncbi:hypothetical protein ABFS82_04G064300 [Erythranthe guttata]|nr:PREDICTED: uncharacterized protein LOC105975936 [Erythranthe guttata]|eukprot:XP_012856682.1 PREDICTED: uncharacterized protein LOC105975936 [Erythranthe guttata]
MNEVPNDEQSHEMHSEDDKALLDENNNTKRSVKTYAQVQVLKKFYNEHKYPPESIQTQLAESIGLSEKQVSEWFCHQRLKDKSLMTNADNYVIRKHDLSSGPRQDSCGSIKKQGHDAYSGSSSSLRDMSNHRTGGDPTLDMATSNYFTPKYPLMDVKTRPGRSGYLKVKGQHEMSAVTVVMKQMGKHYREDGPPLSVEFDLLPPGAFESPRATCYAEEDVLATSPDYPKIHQHPNFGKGCGYNSRMASQSSNTDGTRSTKPQGSDIPNSYIHQAFKQNNSLPNNGAYGARMNSFLPLDEVSATENIFGGENRDNYGMRYRYGVEGKRMASMQPFGEILNREKESTFRKYNDVGGNISKGENIENLTVKDFKIHNSFDQVHHRQTNAKDGRTYAERWTEITNENQVHKRTRNEFPQSYT